MGVVFQVKGKVGHNDGRSGILEETVIVSLDAEKQAERMELVAVQDTWTIRTQQMKQQHRLSAPNKAVQFVFATIQNFE